MEVIDSIEITKKFPYLSDSSINIESGILNGETLCVTVTTNIKKLKELVNSYGWNCIFDNNVADNTPIFTCIVKKI